ncbi:MAG: tRNA (N6-threonylcarbamoyladenosine(37)-N6)-methyltransferase TrmO [Victivallaceae bacterium]|nr:tRNA (N6-threonylcarbamoyladenosine(37)-N6)-methyltransferase TrmO [Victivallaceae bacterium]
MSIKEINYTPIGFMHCAEKHRYETPRQGVFADNCGTIELNPGYNFEQALRDLDGFDHIWVLFDFHLNTTWKPLVKPPCAPDGEKISMFATRSPHRPNSIGMSCVELVGIEKNLIHIRNFDLLDGTLIIDIKPYIPAADSFPDAATGWLPEPVKAAYKIQYSAVVRRQLKFIAEHSSFDIKKFIELQLGINPFDNARKRLICLDEQQGRYQLAFRTWRIDFLSSGDRQILVGDIHSAYTADELQSGTEDRYEDKDLHRKFLKIFT